MRSAILLSAVASLMIGIALAQPAIPPVTPSQGETALPRSFDRKVEPGNPAIKTTEGNNPGAPVTGANSFTEAQAKSHIEANGYINVSGLKKDENGVWRGIATKGGNKDKPGQPVSVSLDYQGNIVVN